MYQQNTAETEFTHSFLQSWRVVLRDVVGVSMGCKQALTSSADLDLTQHRLTRLLEEALKRHRSYCVTVRSYTSSLDDMTSRVQSEKRSLAAQGEWQRKYERLMKEHEAARSSLYFIVVFIAPVLTVCAL